MFTVTIIIVVSITDIELSCQKRHMTLKSRLCGWSSHMSGNQPASLLAVLNFSSDDISFTCAIVRSGKVPVRMLEADDDGDDDNERRVC